MSGKSKKKATGKTAPGNNLWVENFLTDTTAPLTMKSFTSYHVQ